MVHSSNNPMQYKVKTSEPSMIEGIPTIPVSAKYYGMNKIPRPTNALKIDAAAAPVPNFLICADFLCFELRS